jgi:hypothetical protein
MPKEISPCGWCGKVLERWPSRMRGRLYGAFCDRHCLGHFRTQHLVREKAANYKVGSRHSREYIEVEAHWHPGRNKRGYVSLHRLVLEARLGRFLRPDEIVHHRDHDKRNNHWENLEPMAQSEHMKHHLHPESA